MEAAASSGCANARLRPGRGWRRRGAGGAHLFDLVILELGEVIGQELRGDHAGGRGCRAAGVGPVSLPQPRQTVVLPQRLGGSSSSSRGSSPSARGAASARALLVSALPSSGG